MNFKQSFIAVSVFNVVSMSSVFAAESATLTVTGTIKPSSCNASFPTGSEVNFGDNIQLNKSGITTPNDKKFQFSIQCPDKTTVAFKVIDNKPGVPASVQSAKPDSYFGLGESGGKKIGGYYIGFVDFIGLDSVTPLLVSSSAESGTWAKSDYLRPDKYYAIGSGVGGDNPGAYKTHEFKFVLAPAIAPKVDLNLSSAVKLDGSLTYELKYL